MDQEIIHQTTLVTLDCYECGMPIGLQKQFVERARAVGNFKKTFQCPYCGKKQGWGESQYEKEKKELQEQLSEALSSKKHFADLSEHYRKSRNGLKGVLAKEKKRRMK